jgi:hypothetical protein
MLTVILQQVTAVTGQKTTLPYSRQLPGYRPVAASEHAGEQALRARQTALLRSGIRMVVVTGDLVEGTITPRLLERAAPGLAGHRRRQVGALPTAAEMATAIAEAVTNPEVVSGTTVVVEGPLETLTRP